MSEQSDPNAPGPAEGDPADALAALSADKKEHDFSANEELVAEDASDALGRLSAGELDPAELLANPERLAEENAPQAPPRASAAPEAGVSGAASTGGSPSPARPVRPVAMAARQAQSHAHAYRKLMVPVLLTVGALLIVVGFASGYMIMNDSMPDSNFALLVVMAISFPLAAALFFGAWWFIREIRAHPQANPPTIQPTAQPAVQPAIEQPTEPAAPASGNESTPEGA